MKAENEKFGLYTVDVSYVESLHKVDSEVFFDKNGYDKKPYVGIVITTNNINYFIPLTSAKRKHLQWKNVTESNAVIYEITNKSNMPKDAIFADVNRKKGIVKHILAVLEIKKMIPVPDGLYKKVVFSDITDISYRYLLEKEYQFLMPLKDNIVKSAYKLYTEQKTTGIIHPFFCNFDKLETVYKSVEKTISNSKTNITAQEKQQKSSKNSLSSLFNIASRAKQNSKSSNEQSQPLKHKNVSL